ncbi:hypothetical protein QBC35DRAFT_505603 [Podospora australis]|uniref:Uncharacterized protein n=1 Tax=Podospora australis TaxID=1536484 RepID=A0AAN7AG32_9PEZI|nr:hypothetical protein QBC35DRAFT_505603 [Podospora australis]
MDATSVLSTGPSRTPCPLDKPRKIHRSQQSSHRPLPNPKFSYLVPDRPQPSAWVNAKTALGVERYRERDSFTNLGPDGSQEKSQIDKRLYSTYLKNLEARFIAEDHLFDPDFHEPVVLTNPQLGKTIFSHPPPPADDASAEEAEPPKSDRTYKLMSHNEPFPTGPPIAAGCEAWYRSCAHTLMEDKTTFKYRPVQRYRLLEHYHHQWRYLYDGGPGEDDERFGRQRFSGGVSRNTRYDF